MPNSSQPLVKACETETRYEFWLNSHYVEFDKEQLRESIRQKIWDWAKLDSISTQGWESAQVEYWLSFTDATAASPAVRVVVTHLPVRNFYASLSFGIDEDALSDSNMSVLDPGKTYPKAFGYAATFVLLTPNSSTEDTLKNSIEACHGFIQEKTQSFWQIKVSPLKERDFCTCLEKSTAHPSAYRSCEMDFRQEWASAIYGKAFEFPLRPQL